MISEKGQVIVPFTADAIEYFKKVMKNDTWHKFNCYLIKRGDDICCVSQVCLVVDPAHTEE